MGFNEAIKLLTGVALFLFGMGLMGDGLKRLSGNSLAPILFRLSGTPLKGMLLGTGVTAVIQSSCATAVMTVGFVNSGMMKVRQAVGVILGAILGTSITGWVICLSYLDSSSGIAAYLSTATLTGIVGVVGILLRMTAKKQSTRHLGDILMGFTVLMYGMSAMSGAVSSLREDPRFLDMMTSMSNPLVGILIGALFTALLQSASAAVGIVQALSFTGAMTAAEALILYKGRDISEKLFAADKSFIGSKSMRVHSAESLSAKLFLEFIALIVRNRIYNLLKELMLRMETNPNYLTVPAAIRELEKIEMVRRNNGTYRLDHAVSKKQKVILSSFGLSEDDVLKSSNEIGQLLARNKSLIEADELDADDKEEYSDGEDPLDFID